MKMCICTTCQCVVTLGLLLNRAPGQQCLLAAQCQTQLAGPSGHAQHGPCTPYSTRQCGSTATSSPAATGVCERVVITYSTCCCLPPRWQLVCHGLRSSAHAQKASQQTIHSNPFMMRCERVWMAHTETLYNTIAHHSRRCISCSLQMACNT